MITTNKIPFDLIPDLILWSLDQKGLTTHEIESEKGVKYDGENRQDSHASWHHNEMVRKAVAEKLMLDSSMWGKDRTSNVFFVAMTRAIAKLRESKQITTWKVSRRLVLRLTNPPTKRIVAPEIILDNTDILQKSMLTEDATETQMGKIFISILKKGRKDNTYKFALARAILEYCNTDTINREKSNVEFPSRNEISYEYFAEKFLRYYWHQECKFKIKQDSHIERMPTVIHAIRNSFGEKNLPADFKQTKEIDRENAKKLILRDVFGSIRSKKSMVVPKFQNITSGRAKEQKIFYDYDNKTKKIFLKKGVFEFFNKYNEILSGLVLAEWAKFLEKRNGGLPQLVAKIEARDPTRSSLTCMRKILQEHQNHCFYHNGKLEKNYIEVDHFIPWSYIFNNDEWNLVLACKTCNRKKSNALAQEDLADELIKRNTRYYSIVPEIKKSIDMIDIRRGWKSEIRNYYSSCIEYGFDQIKLP